MKRLYRKEKGATMVEAAIALGAFFFLSFGFIDLSWVMYQKIILTYAVEHGAKTAALSVLPFHSTDPYGVQICKEKKKVAKEAITEYLDRFLFMNHEPATFTIKNLHLPHNPYEIEASLAYPVHCLLICRIWFHSDKKEIESLSRARYEIQNCKHPIN